MIDTRAKIAAKAITNTRIVIDIWARTFTRAIATSKFLATPNFQRLAHLRQVAYWLAYLYINEWCTFILEAISRVNAIFENQCIYIIRVERLPTECPYLYNPKVQYTNILEVANKSISYRSAHNTFHIKLLDLYFRPKHIIKTKAVLQNSISINKTSTFLTKSHSRSSICFLGS